MSNFVFILGVLMLSAAVSGKEPQPEDVHLLLFIGVVADILSWCWHKDHRTNCEGCKRKPDEKEKAKD